MDILYAAHPSTMNMSAGSLPGPGSVMHMGAILNISNASWTNHNRSRLEEEHSHNWTVIPIFYIVTLAVSVTGNGTLLWLFVHDPTLRTIHAAFNVYAMNLLFTNALASLIIYPMGIVSNIHNRAWYMGDGACTLYLYALNCLEAVTVNTHALIAVNRLWAIIHPTSYRTSHSVRVAVLSCLGVWVYAHLVMVPGWAMDTLYYRLPVAAHGCVLNARAQLEWANTKNFVVFMVPWVVILLAFPIICCARILRLLRIPGVGGTFRVGDVNHPPAVIADNSLVVSHGADHHPEQAGSAATRVLPRRAMRRLGTQYFMLAALTISVTVCWTPSFVFFSMVYLSKHVWYNANFYQAVTVLFSCQPMLDPVLICLSFVRVRQSLLRLFTPRPQTVRRSPAGHDLGESWQ